MAADRSGVNEGVSPTDVLPPVNVVIEQAEAISNVLTLMEVPGSLGVYVLGCFAQYITLYSQQVRALNLVYALFQTCKLGKDSRVAVVGGGAAGLTAAVAVARLGAQVTLLEKFHDPICLQHSSTKRYVHPHNYDWPATGSANYSAGLPILDWTAGYAVDVADQFRRKWNEEVVRYRAGDQVRPVFGVKSVRIDRAATAGPGPIPVTYQTSGGAKPKQFDIVILAVGFGTEPPGGLQFPYWTDDSLDTVSENVRCLVLGCGDGALTDLMRLCLKDFRHAEIVTKFAADPTSCEVGKELLDRESRFRSILNQGNRMSVPRIGPMIA